MTRNILVGFIATAFWILVFIQIYKLFPSKKENIIIGDSTVVTNTKIYKNLEGRWTRPHDNIIIEYLSHPTNKFQVINGDSNSYNIGLFKIVNINLTDSINNIYDAENLCYNDDIKEYRKCNIRMLNDTTMLVSYPSTDSYDIYHKIIDKKVYDNYYLNKLKGTWFNAEDSVYIKYITPPTNILQTQNTSRKRYLYLKGETEYTDIAISDTINNIFTGLHLHNDIYHECTIQLVDDNTLFMNYKYGAQGVIYKKIK